MTHRFLKKIEGVSTAKTSNNSTCADGTHQEVDYNPNMVVYRKVINIKFGIVEDMWRIYTISYCLNA